MIFAEILSLCGPDGVGKTTQIRLLRAFLGSLDYDTKYLWIRSPHTIAYIIYFIFKKFGYDKPILKTNLEKSLWLWIELFGLVPKLIEVWVLKLATILRKRKTIFLAERYLLDSIITMITYFTEELRNRWVLVLGESTKVLPKLLKKLGTADIFFHDSRHTYKTMMKEYSIVWAFLKTEGLLLSHDIKSNDAFLDFVDRIKAKPIVIGNIGVAHKLSSDIEPSFITRA